MGAVWTVLLTLITIVLVYLLRWALRRREKLQVFKNLGINGPKPDFFTGNMFQLGEESTLNEVVTKWLKKYGNVFGYFVGEVPYIVIKDLDMLKQIFVKDFHVFMDRPGNPMDEFQNLVNLQGKRWKEVRSILTPTFTSGKIKQMTEILQKKVDVTVSEIGKKAENGEMFEIYQMFQGLTLDVIADCAFAMKTNCQRNPDDKLLTAVRKAFLFGNNKAFLLSIIFPFLTPVLLIVKHFLTTTGQMLSFILEHLQIVIDTRRNNPAMKGNDFLQLVMDANQNDSKIRMTDEDIMSNALLFLLAGYETTSTALAFTFELLIKNPDVQEKLYQEIADAEDCSYNTIQNLRYLDQVLNESLRFYPPVTGALSRTCLQDHQVGSITIPKGTKVLAPVWDIHHDPDLWPDPWKFDPERFSQENKANIPSMAYLPFGAGPRNCIGSRFALLEAKMVLFKLLKAFRFETCDKTEDPLTLTCLTVIINPAKGVFLRAVSRF